jgi:hypothetical protein
MRQKKLRHGPSGCPSECSGGNGSRQGKLTDQQLENLTGTAKALAGANRGSTLRCSYCGSVYIRGCTDNFSGMPTDRILGDLDNGILGEGWHPSHR